MPEIICRIVEVCVFRFQNDRPEYLLLRRSPDEPLYPNLWQLVSGTIRDGEKATEAALRELREETMFVPERFWIVPFVGSFYDHRSDALNFSTWFAAQVGTGSEPELSPEHDRYEWLPFEDALSRIVWPGQRQGLDTVQRYLVSGESAGRFSGLQV
jgi:dATP pyrophosphohydrolase